MLISLHIKIRSTQSWEENKTRGNNLSRIPTTWRVYWRLIWIARENSCQKRRWHMGIDSSRERLQPRMPIIPSVWRNDPPSHHQKKNTLTYSKRAPKSHCTYQKEIVDTWHIAFGHYLPSHSQTTDNVEDFNLANFFQISENTFKTYGICLWEIKWRKESLSSYLSHPATNAKIETEQK